MSDECDFCGRYCDPIGCDTARTVTYTGTLAFWCGQCVEGRTAFWGGVPVADLRATVERNRAWCRESGLSFERRGDSPGAWWDWLQRYDEADQIERFLTETEASA